MDDPLLADLEETWRVLVEAHNYAVAASIENGAYEAGAEQYARDWIAKMAEKYGFEEE